MIKSVMLPPIKKDLHSLTQEFSFKAPTECAGITWASSYDPMEMLQPLLLL